MNNDTQLEGVEFDSYDLMGPITHIMRHYATAVFGRAGTETYYVGVKGASRPPGYNDHQLSALRSQVANAAAVGSSALLLAPIPQRHYICIYLSIDPAIYLPFYVSVTICLFLSTSLSNYLPIYLSVYLSLYHLPLCFLPIYLPINLSISLAIYLSMHLFIYLSIPVSVSISTSIHLYTSIHRIGFL